MEYNRGFTDDNWHNISGEYANDGNNGNYSRNFTDDGDRNRSNQYAAQRISDPVPDYEDDVPLGAPSAMGGQETHYDRYPHNGHYELHDMEEGRYDNNRPLHREHQTSMKHRRNRSHHLNGYDYYRQIRHHVNAGFQPDDTDDYEDRISTESLRFEDLKQARQFLATIRVRRSKKNTFSPSEDDSPDRQGDGDKDGYEEQVGLPSTRQKLKGLTEKLQLARQQQLRTDVAKEYRAAVSLSEGTVLPLQSSKWAKGFQDVSTSVSGVVSRLNLWSRQFKEIEGRFGIATATYFRFIRWLVKINFMVLFLFLCFIYIPQLSYTTIFDQNPFKDQNVSRSTDVMFRCSSSYNEHVENVSESGGWEVLLDIAQGTGILENTMLFYGFYSNLTFFLPDDTLEVRYNMGLGYLLTVGMCFLVVFIMIVKNSSRTIRDIVIDFDNKTFPVYTNAVFCGWDYCINTKNMAFFKQKILYTELKAALEEVESKRRRDGRTGREKARLYSKRFAVNLLVLALLGGSFYAIYVATDFLLEKQSEDLSDFVGLLINYLPSIVISVLNVIIPEIFLLLSEVEDYTQGFSTSITIIRAVFLRLASVGVLIVSLYYRLQQNRERETYACPEEYKFSANFTRCCGNTLWQTDLENDQTGKGSVKCWESYVGQQFYKLGLTDFFSAILLFLLIKIPRKLIYDQLKDKIGIIKKIGLSKFDLPLQVLDIVYSQTLCWMGMFFTPLMPVITFIKVFIFFFLRKLELRTVTESPENTYRASRSYSFFQIILLVSFIIVSGLLGYMIGNLQPSMSCGPFRLYSSPDFVMFDVISNEVASWPSVPRVIVQFFGTVAFFLPAFLILLLAIYYYWACASGYKKMEELLKEQLKSEAHDKQFLLARVDEVIKKGQLRNEDYR